MEKLLEYNLDKFTTNELDNETGYSYFGARYYDSDLSSWLSVDPMADERSWVSPYSYCQNNPLNRVDPTGALDVEIDDNITVNSEGKVTHVEKNNQPNRYFDENGNELFFNDPNGVDGDYFSENTQINIGDRLFYSISGEDMYDAILNSGIITERYSGFLIPGSIEYSYLVAISKSHNEYDFAEKYLTTQIKDGISYNFSGARGRTNYQDGTAFFKFGNKNTIYNLYDAGNYMWGAAMSLSGFSYQEVKLGSKLNSIITTLSIDTKADQRAIKNGFYGY